MFTIYIYNLNRMRHFIRTKQLNYWHKWESIGIRGVRRYGESGPPVNERPSGRRRPLEIVQGLLAPCSPAGSSSAVSRSPKTVTSRNVFPEIARLSTTRSTRALKELSLLLHFRFFTRLSCPSLTIVLHFTRQPGPL